MKELERLLKIRKCHFELYYSSVMDFCMKLYLKGFNDDGSDLIIFDEQDCDLHMANLCDMLGVNDCGFKESDKSLNHEL